jgi:enoyl-[acyl-carrier-protein] reductase (NADH)
LQETSERVNGGRVRFNMSNADRRLRRRAATVGAAGRRWGRRERASRGLDPSALQDCWRQRNLLRPAVTRERVGNAVVFFASNLTPSSLPVAEAFPR